MNTVVRLPGVHHQLAEGSASVATYGAFDEKQFLTHASCSEEKNALSFPKSISLMPANCSVADKRDVLQQLRFQFQESRQLLQYDS